MVKVLIILGLVIAFVIGKFFFDRKKLLEKVKRQGGMEKKYEILIGTMLQEPGMKIQTITDDTIHMSFRGEASIGATIIVQGFDSITVQWKQKSCLGEAKGQLEMPEHLDQMLMVEKINEAIQIGFKKHLRKMVK